MRILCFRAGFSAVLSALLIACGTPHIAVTPSTPARLREQVFHTAKLVEMDDVVTRAIAEQKLPGGVLWLERDGASYVKAYGQRAVAPVAEPMTVETIFDVASLTKVLATTPALLLLIERGQVQVDAPVATYLPEFATEGKKNVTLRHLMTHTSGLRPGLASPGEWSGYAKAIEIACAEKLRTEPGVRFVYSDINFIVLGEVVRRVSGKPLPQFCAEEIYAPLKMFDTGFLLPAAKHSRCAPTTEEHDLGWLRGVVHDPTARRMGGVAGHAGLFTTTADTARFARMLLNGGTLDGARIFQPETVRLMTTVQSPKVVSVRRGLGWDIDSPYSGPRGKLFPLGSYGHTGWTGTSLWIDPLSRTFVIFYANRNHPAEAGSVIALRAQLGTLAAEAVRGFDFKNISGTLLPSLSPTSN